MPWLWDRSIQILELAGYSASYEITATIIFFLLDSTKDLLLGIPWSLYSTFVIEQRHGFNKQTLGIFFTDLLKQVSLMWSMCMHSCRMLAGSHAAYIVPCCHPYMKLPAFLRCSQQLAPAQIGLR